MITIKVGGTPLYIPSDTALVFEQNNAALGDEGISADVMWTFEIPAEPNQRILGAVQYLYSGGNRRYECELAVDGVPFSRGELYIQSATDERRLSCGIVANDFAIGFGDRLLRENDYGNNVVISQTENGHKQGWRDFLLESLKGYSIYKFFLFVNSKFYDNNDDYGYHSNKISPLVESNNEKADLTTGYVNRLFFGMSSLWGSWPNITYSINEDAETAKRGCRLFNVANREKQNGYCFAPALRLDWLVRKVFENAALSSRGTFFTSPYIKKLYSQSMNAMDGDIYQYGINTWLRVGGNITLYNGTINKCQQFEVDSDQSQHTSFGWGTGVNFGFRLLLPEGELVRNYKETDRCHVEEYHGKVLDEVYALAVGSADSTLPTIRCRSLSFMEADGTPGFLYGKMPTVEELRERLDITSYYSMAEFDNFSNGSCRIRYVNIFDHYGTVQFYTKTGCHLVQLTKSNGKDVFFRSELGGYTEGTVRPRFKPAATDAVPLYVRLVKCSIISAKEDITVKIKNPSGTWSEHTAKPRNYGELEYITDYEILDAQAIDTTDIPLNIFSSVLRWRDHVPNLTNGEFLAKVCEAFGLQMFVNPMTREVQLDFFRDVLKGTSLDISQWVTGKERMEYAPKKYTISFSPTIGKKEVAEQNIIGSVPTKEDLPPAVVRKNKHSFVENELANRRSTQVKDTSQVRWEQSGGDTRKLEAGTVDASEAEEIEIGLAIPNMTYADEISKEADKYVCQVETKGCSAMLDEDYNGEFDMVLQQYHGKRMLLPSLYIEDANPTIYRQNGTENANAISLAAVGKRSIGEMWLRPLYDLKGNCDRYRLVAHLPSWAFLKVMATLQPQDGSPYEQERWLYCDGLKIMPTKISSELSGRESIVCTIEGVAPHVDISGL